MSQSSMASTASSATLQPPASTPAVTGKQGTPFRRSHRRQRTETDLLAACGAPLLSPRVAPSRTAPSSPAMPSRDVLATTPAPVIFIPDLMDPARYQRRDFEKEDVALLSMLPPPLSGPPPPHSRGRQQQQSREASRSARSLSRSRGPPPAPSSPALVASRLPTSPALHPGGATTPRTPSPLLPTIQHTDEDDEEEEAVEVVAESSPVPRVQRPPSSVRHRRISQPPQLRVTVAPAGSTEVEVIVSAVAAPASPLPSVPATPLDEKHSTLSPLPGPRVLGQHRRRRVNTPTFVETSTSRAEEGVDATPRRNSYQWDRRSSAYLATLEARDRSATPPRRLSAASLWNAATSSIMGRLGFGVGAKEGAAATEPATSQPSRHRRQSLTLPRPR